MLTKSTKLLRMPAKKYMDSDQLEYFQSQLVDQKQEAISEIEDARERLRIPPECKDEMTEHHLKLIPNFICELLIGNLSWLKKLIKHCEELNLGNMDIVLKLVVSYWS